MIDDFSDEQFANYKIYLSLVEEKMLNKYFEEQKPYIFCKEGCSYCCERGQYPVTKIELAYILLGFSQFSNEKKSVILNKIQKLKQEKIKFEAENPNSEEGFMYECPFLENHKCSVYEYRAIICRTHGLMFFIDDAKTGEPKNKIPFCVNLGLNYSNIYDEETKTLSDEKMFELGIEQEPLAYNLSLKTLQNKDIAKNLGFEFGEIKTMIDWFPD